MKLFKVKSGGGGKKTEMQLAINNLRRWVWQGWFKTAAGVVELPLSAIRQLIALTLRWLMSYIYEAPIPDVSRSHTTTQHSR
jgi:hypothetical protein